MSIHGLYNKPTPIHITISEQNEVNRRGTPNSQIRMTHSDLDDFEVVWPFHYLCSIS